MLREKILARSVRIICASGIVAGLGFAALPALAQETGAQKIEITGSSIKRAQSEGALPVQIMSREDVQKVGANSTEQLLQSISSISNVGSSNVAQGVGLSTYGLSSVSLRGIGQSKTLVLVNGRRLANYATDGTAVDINSIPLAAIDRVEILKDGASGVYGSDAIGGVINFILRSNFTGTEVNATAGTTKDGGGASYKAGILHGWGDLDKDRYNITVGIDVTKEKRITGGQRGYAKEAWDESGMFDQSATPSGAVRTFRPNTTANSQGIILNSLANQGSGLGNPLAPEFNGGKDRCAENGSKYSPVDGTCRFNFAPFADLVPDVKRANLSANFRFKLNDETEFFAEGFVSKQTQLASAQPSPYSVSFLAPDALFATRNVYPAIIMSPSSPYYPSAFLAANAPEELGKPVTVSYRAYDGGGRVHEDVATQMHLTTGFKGTFKGYDYDVAYNHNSSSVTESTQSGYQNQIQVVQLLSNNNAFNPFVQRQSAALEAQIAATNYNGSIINSVLSTDSLDGKFSGELFQLPAGPLSFALGGSLRVENLNLNPSAAYQSGDIAGYGLQVLPIQASRHSDSIFGELNVPILKGLESGIALRTDRFTGVTSTNPKINIRYQPFSIALFRASWGKGFRQAALPELYNPQAAGTTASFTDPVTGVRNQFNQLIGGNPKLKPETSEQSSIGFVIDPVKDMSVSVDYWKIRVTNLITTLGGQFIVQQAADGNANYTGLVSRDNLGNITNIINTNQNVGGVSTAGVDIDLKWKFLKSSTFGNSGVHLNGTYMSKYDQTLADGTVQSSVAQTIDKDGNPLNAVAAGGIVFRWKHSMTFDWNMGDFGASLTQNYQAGYHDSARADCSDCTIAERVKAFQTWDLQGSYKGIKNVELRAGLKNMLNKKPPVSIGLGNYFQTGFDPSYYDPHGMFGYVTASYKF